MGRPVTRLLQCGRQRRAVACSGVVPVEMMEAHGIEMNRDVELKGFGDGLDVGMREKEKSKMSPAFKHV